MCSPCLLFFLDSGEESNLSENHDQGFLDKSYSVQVLYHPKSAPELPQTRQAPSQIDLGGGGGKGVAR